MENPSVAAPAAAVASSTAEVMTVKDWIITSIITMIPGIGFVMLFVWAFGSGTNPNKANWAKALLIVTVAFFALMVLFSTLFGGLAFLSGMS